jgi:hypothetical protein
MQSPKSTRATARCHFPPLDLWFRLLLSWHALALYSIHIQDDFVCLGHGKIILEKKSIQISLHRNTLYKYKYKKYKYFWLKIIHLQPNYQITRANQILDRIELTALESSMVGVATVSMELVEWRVGRTLRHTWRLAWHTWRAGQRRSRMWHRCRAWRPSGRHRGEVEPRRRWRSARCGQWCAQTRPVVWRTWQGRAPPRSNPSLARCP